MREIFTGCFTDQDLIQIEQELLNKNITGALKLIDSLLRPVKNEAQEVAHLIEAEKEKELERITTLLEQAFNEIDQIKTLLQI